MSQETTVKAEETIAVYELRVLFRCPVADDVLPWVNVLTELRHKAGCVSASMEPIIDKTKVKP